MIQFIPSFASINEIEYLLSFWNKGTVYEYNTHILRFIGISFTNEGIPLTNFKRNVFDIQRFESVRLQKYNEDIKQIETYHSHKNEHNYVLFLNDDFEGGELVFEDGVTIKPTKGSLVYFTRFARHKVNNCKGDRYIFIASGDQIAPPDKLNIRTDGII